MTGMYPRVLYCFSFRWALSLGCILPQLQANRSCCYYSHVRATVAASKVEPYASKQVDVASGRNDKQFATALQEVKKYLANLATIAAQSVCYVPHCHSQPESVVSPYCPSIRPFPSFSQAGAQPGCRLYRRAASCNLTHWGASEKSDSFQAKSSP